MNIVILYTRLPGYFLSCLKHLVNKHPQARVCCVVYKPSSEAPFRHILPEQISIVNKEEVENLREFVATKRPDILYVTGWSDKNYKSVAAHYVSSIPVILGLDNPWKGNLRQKIGALYAKTTLKKYFNRIWVPGLRQYEFARKLGFSHGQVLQGLYCADTSSLYSLPVPGGNSKTVLFAGRMVAFKNPGWMVDAFLEWNGQGKFIDWQLLLLGNGPLTSMLKEKANAAGNIGFIEFVQPDELPSWFSKASVFCLPSTHEHWGVVVQEAAAAGLPLLLSDTCGAADSFLIHGSNGLLFQSDNYTDFKIKLEKLMVSHPNSLLQMGENSRMLAGRITANNWVDTLVSVIQ